MSEINWSRHSDTEIRATIDSRAYAIYRRQFPGGLKYYAWCEWRGEFTRSGFVSPHDTGARTGVVDDLKAECHHDAHVGGISSWNWQ